MKKKITLREKIFFSPWAMLSVFILSMLLNLYFNMKINVISSDLEQIRNEILILEIEKSKVHLKHTEEFSIGNIEILSREINFSRLDVYNKNFDLVNQTNLRFYFYFTMSYLIVDYLRNSNSKVIATGGLSQIFKNKIKSIDLIEQNLTINGLAYFYLLQERDI